MVWVAISKTYSTSSLARIRVFSDDTSISEQSDYFAKENKMKLTMTSILTNTSNTMDLPITANEFADKAVLIFRVLHDGSSYRCSSS